MAIDDDIICIDLGPLGATGTVIMDRPGLRRQKRLKNELSRLTMSVDGSTPVVEDVPFGDLETLEVLAFVKEAPFVISVESFYDFCDEMDRKKPQASVTLYRFMKDAADKLSEGYESPLGL